MALATAMKGLDSGMGLGTRKGEGRNGEGFASLGCGYVHLQFILSPVWGAYFGFITPCTLHIW